MFPTAYHQNQNSPWSFAVTQGDGAKIVRDAFVLAKEKAPALVVLGHPRGGVPW